MFNKVIMVGNLTRDIELRYLQSGTAIGTSGLATNRKFKKQDGSQGDEVCFIDITFFGRSAEIANQYLRRGSKILIEGRLKFEQWSDQSGNKRSKHAITVETMQMLDSRRDDSYSNSNYSNPNQTNSYQNNQNSFSNQGANTNNYYQDNDNGSSANRASNSSSASSNSYTNNIPEIDIDEEDIPF